TPPRGIAGFLNCWPQEIAGKRLHEFVPMVELHRELRTLLLELEQRDEIADSGRQLSRLGWYVLGSEFEPRIGRLSESRRGIGMAGFDHPLNAPLGRLPDGDRVVLDVVGE